MYRIGGDEFVVVSEESTVEEFTNRMGACIKKLGEQNIYCAIGFETYDSADDIESVIRTADAMMYEDKWNYYSDTLLK